MLVHNDLLLNSNHASTYRFNNQTASENKNDGGRAGMNPAEEHSAIDSYKKTCLKPGVVAIGVWCRIGSRWGWELMSQEEQQAALSEDRFTRDYLDDGKISYL